jgi:SOS response regulatory protein OraA/RecX
MAFEITDEVIRQVEALAAQGLSEEQIGSVIGCSRETIRRRKNDNEAFEASIKRGKHKGVAKVTNALFQKAVKGDNVAMIFFLKNRDPDNWRDRVENVVTANHTVNKIEIEVIGGDADLTD